MNFSDLAPDVLLNAPGCPEVLAETTLRRTAIKFCRETHVWQEQIDNLYPVNSILRYKLTPPDGTQIIAIASMQHIDGENRTDIDELPKINPLGYLTFNTQPATDNGPLEVKVILAPSKTAAEMPDFIGEGFREGLIGGALAFLLAMPQKDFSNPAMVEYFNSMYNEAKSEAKFRRNTGNTEGQLRVAPRHLL